MPPGRSNPFTPLVVRPPHPATVAQPRQALRGPAPRPPHPATTAQPSMPVAGPPTRPPHPAMVGRLPPSANHAPGLIVQRANDQKGDPNIARAKTALGQIKKALRLISPVPLAWQDYVNYEKLRQLALANPCFGNDQSARLKAFSARVSAIDEKNLLTLNELLRDVLQDWRETKLGDPTHNKQLKEYLKRALPLDDFSFTDGAKYVLTEDDVLRFVAGVGRNPRRMGLPLPQKPIAKVLHLAWSLGLSVVQRGDWYDIVDLPSDKVSAWVQALNGTEGKARVALGHQYSGTLYGFHPDQIKEFSDKNPNGDEHPAKAQVLLPDGKADLESWSLGAILTHDKRSYRVQGWERMADGRIRYKLCELGEPIWTDPMKVDWKSGEAVVYQHRQYRVQGWARPDADDPTLYKYQLMPL